MLIRWAFSGPEAVYAFRSTGLPGTSQRISSGSLSRRLLPTWRQNEDI